MLIKVLIFSWDLPSILRVVPGCQPVWNSRPPEKRGRSPFCPSLQNGRFFWDNSAGKWTKDDGENRKTANKANNMQKDIRSSCLRGFSFDSVDDLMWKTWSANGSEVNQGQGILNLFVAWWSMMTIQLESARLVVRHDVDLPSNCCMLPWEFRKKVRLWHWEEDGYSPPEE